MTQFARVNGDLQPVVVYDSGIGNSGAGFNNGVNQLIDSATVQPFGPKLNFFTVQGATLEPLDQNVGNAVNAIFQTVQQLSTIAIYEYKDTGSNGAVSMALFDTGAQTAASLQTAIQALGTVSTIDLSAVVVGNAASFSTVS